MLAHRNLVLQVGVSQPLGLRGSIEIPEKSQQHPKDFPGGPPPQYYPGLATVNFRVRMGSGVFDAVWPLAIAVLPKLSGRRFVKNGR